MSKSYYVREIEIKCRRCDHKWRRRKEHMPLTCPKCKRYDWRKRNQDDGYNLKCKKTRNKAGWILSEMIRRGEVPKPEKLRCVDCRKWAQCYDHRNYAKPLEIVPVCTACNLKRCAGIIK